MIHPMRFIVAGGILMILGPCMVVMMVFGEGTTLRFAEVFACESDERLVHGWETHTELNPNSGVSESTTFEYDCRGKNGTYRVTDRVMKVQRVILGVSGLGLLMMVVTSGLWMVGVFRPEERQREDDELPVEIVPYAKMDYGAVRQRLVPDDSIFSPADIKDRTRIFKMLLQYGIITMAEYDELIDAVLAQQE